MDFGIIIAICGAAISMIGTVIALFLWNRSEANSDRRDMVNIVLAIQSEVKDFHYKLLEIEKGRK